MRKEELASSVAAPRRRRPTFSGMFSVLLPVPLHFPSASCERPTSHTCVCCVSPRTATLDLGGQELRSLELWRSSQARGHWSRACPQGIRRPWGRLSLCRFPLCHHCPFSGSKVKRQMRLPWPHLPIYAPEQEARFSFRESPGIQGENWLVSTAGLERHRPLPSLF